MVNLLPALTPLVRIALLGAHIHDLEIIAPSVDILLLVTDAVALNGPLSCTLPLVNATTDVCR